MNSVAYTTRLSMVLPEELTQLKQWLVWRSIPEAGRKPRKRPFQATGFAADVTNPQHWSTFEFACQAMRAPGFADGLGFVFTGSDPYCGIDLDGVWQSDADEGAPWALDIIKQFGDTYGEASPSDTGFKIWCKAKAPRCGKWEVTSGSALEIYDRGRFFTLTGQSNRVRVVADHQGDIERLIADADVEPSRTAQDEAKEPRFREYRISPGQRWNSLVSLAGSMRWRRPHLDESIVRHALLEMNRLHCQGKYSAEEIEQIIRSDRCHE